MKKRKGSADVMVILLIAITMLIIAFVILISYVPQYVVYSNLRQVVRSYEFKIESNGYLSTTDYTNLQNDLVLKNLNLADLTIDYTSVKVAFGNKVYIHAHYNYRKKKLQLHSSGLSINATDDILPMEVDIDTNSKNGS